MKRSKIYLITLIFFQLVIFAEKADFKTAEKFSPENLKKMVWSRSVVPHWTKDSKMFWYSYKTSSEMYYYLVSVSTGLKRKIFTQKIAAYMLSEFTKKKINPEKLDLKNIYPGKRGRKFYFKFGKTNYYYDLGKRRIFRSKKNTKKKSPKYIKTSPDGNWEIYARDYNIYIRKSGDKFEKERKLTNDGEKWFGYSAYDWKYKRGTRVKTIANWFEDSKKIYVKRIDSRKVKDLFLVHSLSQPRPELERYKYAMAGDSEIPIYEISLIDIKTGKKTVVDTGSPDMRIGNESSERVYTTKDSNRLYFIRSSRDYKDVEVCLFDLVTKKTSVLIKERSEPYWNAYFQQFYPVENTGELIWQSERDGREQFYFYDKSGRLKNRITSGDFNTGGIVNVDEKNRVLYFAAYGKNRRIDPYYRFYYRVNFDGTDFKLLTPEAATHRISFSPDRKYFIDTFSTVKKIPVSLLRDNTGKLIKKLETMDIKKLLTSGWKPPETFVVKAADKKTDLWGVMWKPFNFDPSKKYPVISYVYPGPQGEPVPKTFFLVRNERVSNIPLAQLGFIVITVGQRGGSPLRTKEYHNYGYKNARDYPLADNRYAIEQLAEKYKFIDLNKVGIYGRSGGGFMSAAAMLVYPDFYKVAVSSCGNHDNNIYDYEWSELHYENSFKKKIRTNWEIAKNLKGHLLLIHGEVDNNVHPANTLRLVNALIRAGKRFDFMIFPGKRHTYGEYTRYIERMMWYYFAEHLMGDYRSNINIYK